MVSHLFGCYHANRSDHYPVIHRQEDAQQTIARLRGSLSTLLYLLNTLFWFVPVLLLGLLKLLLPKGWRIPCNWLLDGCAGCWMGFNNLIQKVIIRTAFEVVGVDKWCRNEWYR